MLFFTPFEKTIIKTRLKTTLAWIFLCLIYGYFFTVHWFFGFVFLLTIPLPIYLFFYKENLYYPSQSYFQIYFFNHSKEERLLFSEEIELLGKYLFLGEMICLDDYMVLRKFGVVLSYHQIKHIFHEKGAVGRDSTVKDFYYLVTVVTKDNKKYRFKIWNTDEPFVGTESKFSQIISFVLMCQNKI